MNTFKTEIGSTVVTISADFRHAASPIKQMTAAGWSSTPYQVADARHSPRRALAMVIAMENRNFYEDASDPREEGEEDVDYILRTMGPVESD